MEPILSTLSFIIVNTFSTSYQHKKMREKDKGKQLGFRLTTVLKAYDLPWLRHRVLTKEQVLK